jgi:hypothetical protein
MLDMGRRRSARGSGMLEASREATLQMAFDRSRLPQALVSIEGTMFTANKAFNRLVSRDEKGVDGLAITELSIATHVPGLLGALRAVHTAGKPQERRAKVYRGKEKRPLELVVWLSPLPIPGQEIHLLVRVEEIRDENER